MSSIFPANTNVNYRVSALNGVGYSTPSSSLTVLTDNVPAKPAAPTITGEITPVSITISWTYLTGSDDDTGRDAITYYKCEWLRQGSSTWVELTNGNTMTNTITTTNFQDNKYYTIRVSAKNGVGLGPYSDTIQILTDNVPQRMNDPEEDVGTDANNIYVKWAPIVDDVDTGRDPVTYYKLQWD